MKLDLHTHICEATNYARPDRDMVAKLVAKIKEKGLDGIAITEHHDRTCGLQFEELVERYFPGEVLIIPGREINVFPVQIAELFLPGGVTFRFLVHPGYPGDFTDSLDGLHGIEIENPMHSWHIDREKVKATAERLDLLLLRNSDAHYFDDIGKAYNEITIEELVARATRQQ